MDIQRYTYCPISQEKMQLDNEIRLIFFKNDAENEAGRLVPDAFLFFKKALCEVK